MPGPLRGPERGLHRQRFRGAWRSSHSPAALSRPHLPRDRQPPPGTLHSVLLRSGRGAEKTRTPPPELPARSPSPSEGTCKLGLLPPSSCSTAAGGGGVGLGCPRRNRINAPKISGLRRASRWETMPCFQPCPQRPSAAFPALSPPLPIPGRGGRNESPSLLKNMTPIFFPAYFFKHLIAAKNIGKISHLKHC